MKSTTITTLVLMTGVLAQGETSIAAAPRKATVCMEETDTRVAPGVALTSRALASKMFAAIGVAIDWRRGLRHCPADGILISLSYLTPEDLKPRALAYALPYEGTHIRVFYDRVAHNRSRREVALVLAHVLVDRFQNSIAILPIVG